MTLTETKGRIYGYEVTNGQINIIVNTFIKSYETGQLEEVSYTFPFDGDTKQANALINDPSYQYKEVKITIEI